jgi:opacity protein-like surface antigen
MLRTLCVATLACAAATPAFADENLFGYVRGAETLPIGAAELYFKTTRRDDKGAGTYRATDYEVEYEYGVSDRFDISGALQAMSLDTRGLMIDGYLPGDRDFGVRASGFEIAGKYNILRPAADGFGLSLRGGLEHSWIDKHSGQDKDTTSADFDLLMQKYFLDAQLVWVGNLGLEATYAKRAEIDGLPAGFDWSTEPEMEVGLKAGTGVSYRFAPNWYASLEALYETEFETEVGQERWSVFAGPSLHYGAQRWWATLTWLPQLRGGGEQYAGQTDTDLHLIEKTKQEARLKLGLNF